MKLPHNIIALFPGRDFLFVSLILVCCTALAQNGNSTIIASSYAVVSFTSFAPLETISAETRQMKGLLDTQKNAFAFTISVKTFQGFNSPLQREHFLESYVEDHKYPSATFNGKIIESVNYDQPGVYDIRAKGVLDIHGVKQERIIRCKMTVTAEKIEVNSKFSVVLEDHEISIPRIVQEKISPEINVTVLVFFKK